MGSELKKKYGLATAVAMVVGIVVGSGVFFKAESILNLTGGDMGMGVIAWIIGGLIMIACSLAFAVMATKYEYVNGIVDYADVTVGKKYGYYIGWFMASTYTPALTGVLAWVSARYLCVLLNWSISGAQCLMVASFFLVANYALNALSPKLAGKFQIASTVIKLVPLVLMAVFGTIFGLVNGLTVENFTSAASTAVSGSPLFGAIVATAFAYEGWIIATSINAELRDAKKNLPKALLIGAGIIMVIYVCYYIGIAGAVDKNVMMESGQNGAKTAFSTIFSNIGGTVLFVFIIISCLGTLNGLMMGCTRGFYALAVRGLGPCPKMLRQVDKETNMPANASIVGLLLAAFWLLYFYGAIVITIPTSDAAAPAQWFGRFSFDSSELPIVTLYGAYIPMFILFMIKEKEMPPLRRFVIPAFALAGSVFMVVAAVWAHGINVSRNLFEMPIFYYLIVFVVVLLIGSAFAKPKNKAD